MTPTEINKKTIEVKDWITHLSDGRLNYEIKLIFINSATGYQTYYRGNNKKSNIVDKFCRELDAALNNTGVAKVLVVANNGKKQYGEMEIEVIKAYQHPSGLFPMPAVPVITPAKSQPIVSSPQVVPPATGQPAMLNTLKEFFENTGQAFFGQAGLGSIAEEQGVTAVFLSAKEKTMREQFERERTADKLAEMTKHNGILETKVATLETETAKQQKMIERYEDRIEDLEAELAEAVSKNKKYMSYAQFGGSLLGGMMKNTKTAGMVSTMLNGFLGIEDETELVSPPEYNYQPPAPKPAPSQEVLIDDDNKATYDSSI